MSKVFTIHTGKKSQVEDLVHARKKMVDEIKFSQHRLEEVEEIDGVQYINDSSATSIMASKDSLRCMADPVIWIVCATPYDRDFILLSKIVSYKVKSIVVCGLEASDVRNELSGLVDTFVITENMEDAVIEAKGLANEGDVVLFSPSCSAHAPYNDYVERGDDFKSKVNESKARL
jgi:UDP-N-acetylmuramoylalanine--D-glutamate ligase